MMFEFSIPAATYRVFAELKQQRMRDVFTHFNPYTKKRYADDPTLALVEVLNEDSLFWYPESMREPFTTDLRRAFQSWLAKRYGTQASGELPELIPIYDFREAYFAQNPLGTGPVRMEAIEGELRIVSAHAAKMKAWPLDVNGKRGAEIKLSRSHHAVTLTMKAEYEAPYYELSLH